MSGITPKQAEMLKVIVKFEKKNGFAPTIDELASLTGRTRTPTHSMLVQLEQRGRIKRRAGSARSIEVL